MTIVLIIAVIVTIIVIVLIVQYNRQEQQPDRTIVFTINCTITKKPVPKQEDGKVRLYDSNGKFIKTIE
jgi:hypothetical protein